MKTFFDNNDSPLLGWQIEADITAQLDEMQEQLDQQAEIIDKQAALIKSYEAQLRLLKHDPLDASSECIQEGFTQMTIMDDDEIPLPPPE